MQKKLIIAISLFLMSLKAYGLTVPNSSVSIFSSEVPVDKQSVWARPYSSFETIELKNGRIVHNTGYGGFLGYDTKNALTFYTGYTGARQKYGKSIILQNGGQLGASKALFKNDFFGALAINAGATNASIKSLNSNKVNFSMLSSTLAFRGGYNLNLFENKITIQPNFLAGYLFVDTLDYKNQNNITVKSNAVHSIQLMPGIKFSGITKNGAQPYFSVSGVWNIMNSSNFSANDASLGEISLKPYAQYNIGVQKSFKKDVSAYVQSTLRAGGRSGAIFSFGFRKYF